jgi:hypothetical protein
MMNKKGLKEGREANMGHKGRRQTEYFSSLHIILPLLNQFFHYCKTKLRCKKMGLFHDTFYFMLW